MCLGLGSELDVWIPQPFHAEVPADWWDGDADKSLLVGVFKHGRATQLINGPDHRHTLSQLAATQQYGQDEATQEQEVTSANSQQNQ